MTDEWNEMRDRLMKIATNEGLKPHDAEALTDAMANAGVSVFFHASITDAALGDKLHTLASRQPDLFERPLQPADLNGPGPKLPPAFREWLGGLAATFDSIPAARRLGLYQKWQAQQGRGAQPTPAENLRRQLELRHGDVAMAPALDRARLAVLEGHSSTRGAAAQPSAAQAQAIRALPLSQRGAGLSAVQEAAKIRTNIDGLRNSHSGGPMVAHSRATEIDRLEQRLSQLRQRFPTVLAA